VIARFTTISISSFMFDDSQHQERMDRRYRYQRHVFDLSRKFILFGRDRTIAALPLGDARSVLEIGCGTGRNLKFMADAHPTLRLTGTDISKEMLKSARARFARAQFDKRISLQQGDAAIRPIEGKAPRILMSYSLSMVPDWRRTLAVAIEVLQPGGILAIVEFRQFRRLAGLAGGELHRDVVAPGRPTLPGAAAGAAPSRILRPLSAP
jgi:S-adenosylmethionine-diacylgycerolhomoserine-N-methlytransferase